jgi:hypothetical protein
MQPDVCNLYSIYPHCVYVTLDGDGDHGIFICCLSAGHRVSLFLTQILIG